MLLNYKELLKMIFLLGGFFVMSMQPLIMIFILMMVVLLYSLWLYDEMGSFWFGYVLMLVMLSGVLVLFTYMASLVPNENFEMFNLLGGLILWGGLWILYFNHWVKVDYFNLGLGMWEGGFGVWNLYLVGFMFSIMLMVVFISGVNMGAVRVKI